MANAPQRRLLTPRDLDILGALDYSPLALTVEYAGDRTDADQKAAALLALAA